MQTALLLTSQSVHKATQKDSWYWVNTAITIALSIGLHQDSDSSNYSSDCCLRRRLWWCCYVRDKVVALGLGRPTRIKSTEYNVTLLQLEDLKLTALDNSRMLLNHGQIGPHNRSLQLQSAELLIEKTKLCIIIEEILENTAQAATLSREGFDALEASLRSWHANLPESCRYHPATPGLQQESLTSSVHLRQYLLQMVYHTAVYTLHRPRFIPLTTSQSPILGLTQQERKMSRAAVLNAVDQITRMAAELHQRKLDSKLPISAVTVICPAIFVHILNMRSCVRTRREAALLSFRVCMRTLERLRELYPCMDTTITYLEAVLRKVCENGTPLFSNSISDIFTLNKTDLTDIHAVLGGDDRIKEHQFTHVAPSEGAVGLSGLASLLAAGAACDGDLDLDEVAESGLIRPPIASAPSSSSSPSSLNFPAGMQEQMRDHGHTGSFNWPVHISQGETFFDNGLQSLGPNFDLDTFSF